ncbi:DUF1906 domain-containing protein [Streptomyces avicenniae]|uniref:DUF1906 domain-containing protein n=1 Tax=Streptomyces avicenniae TaxID=500153 RepID=UPI000699BBD6|nr:DUF1906 domain-containing protein [Streptomyces avicenniae]
MRYADHIQHTRRARHARPAQRHAPHLRHVLLAFVLSVLLATPATAAEDPRPLPAPTLMNGDLAAEGAEIYEGAAFDTCEAPSLDTMRSWLASPYRAVGVYIGGDGRACPAQPNLTPEWVTEVSALGWHLLPLHVGPQSPCVLDAAKSAAAIDADRPWQQGVAEAADAIASAEALGLAPGSPIYLDIEAYDHLDSSCARTTLAFVQGFSRELRTQGWIPGLYSSSSSGITHMESVRAAGAVDLPDVLWFARWDAPPSLDDEPALDPAAWQPHRRVHQYAGDVSETHGGRRLSIDRNLVHAPVAVLR